MQRDPHVVAVFNTSEDTTDLLRITLEQAGFVAVTGFTNAIRDGQLDLDSYMRQHRPKVVVYDIGLPYDRNWRLFEHLRSSPACEGVEFVVTSTNAAHVNAIAGPQQSVLEIVGKPYDLDELIRAVKEAARTRATR
jgi:DNA-binding response OmpR family regulator